MITKESIVKLLSENDRAVARALVVLNARQTADEQVAENTRYQNGRGFRPCHARMGTSMANFFLKFNRLSDKQIAYWRARDKSGAMRIGIYAGQLLEEAMEKQKLANSQPVGDVGNAEELRNLQYELGMVMDSDDPLMVGKAQASLDNFMAKCRSN